MTELPIEEVEKKLKEAGIEGVSFKAAGKLIRKIASLTTKNENLRKAGAYDLECAYYEGWHDNAGEKIDLDSGWEQSAAKATAEALLASSNEKEGRALDALMAIAFREMELPLNEVAAQRLAENPPALSPEDEEVLEAMGHDYVDRLLRLPGKKEGE